MFEKESESLESNQWRAGLLTSADASSLQNGRLSMFVMMTCLSRYFQNAAADSLSESLMKARGGAIAVWASSGLTLPGQQAVMNQALYRVLLNESVLKKSVNLGEATRRAKLAVSDPDLRPTWVLLGDPTMRIR
jgi:hypothetical protein